MNDPIRWYKDWRVAILASSGFSRGPLPLAETNAWQLDDAALARTDGRFFSVIGMQYVADGTTVSLPMIEETDAGLYAFGIRRSAPETEWLMHFKVEPGNTHGAQLAPTVQATLSNMGRAHGGSAPAFSDLVTKQARTLFSNGLWSARGSRFIGKRNENRTVLVEGDVELPDSDAYRWVPSSTIRALLREEYAVNTATRSTIATAPWDLIGSADGPFHGDLRTSYNAADRGIGYALSVLTQLRKERIPVTRIPLADVQGIVLDKDGPTPVRHPACDVHFLRIAAATREVPAWDQPLVAPHGVGITALILYPDPKGVLRARLTVDRSPGLTHSPEWTATIADVPGTPNSALPADVTVLADVWASDEGARFDNAQTRMVVARSDEPPAVPNPDLPYVDLTLGALERLVRTPGAVTTELRSVVALLLSLS